MNPDSHEQMIGRRSALIYVPLALGAALVFFLAASLTGDFPMVARFGGAAWVGLLSLIVAMPIVTARLKKRHRHPAWGFLPSERGGDSAPCDWVT